MPICNPIPVYELCGHFQTDSAQLAQKSGLEKRIVEAIVQGRWTPSPFERDQLAAAVGLRRDQIVWGHRAAVDHIQGHGPQFGRSP